MALLHEYFSVRQLTPVRLPLEVLGDGAVWPLSVNVVQGEVREGVLLDPDHQVGHVGEDGGRVVGRALARVALGVDTVHAEDLPHTVEAVVHHLYGAAPIVLYKLTRIVNAVLKSLKSI